ncbi:rod shape-determining protein [Candidatus Parcubacteria bacterium]|nr:rod shape-determining protein [Candidatus Parcubacteria bacterium]
MRTTMFKLPRLSLSKTRKRSGGEFLVLDLGSHSVKALFCTVVSSSQVSITRSLEVETPPGSIVYGRIREPEVLREKLRGALDGVALPVVVGISGEAIFGFSTVGRSNRARPEKPLGEKELAAAVKRIEESAFVDAVSRAAAVDGNPEVELELVNAALTSAKADGYFIADPSGYKGQVVEMSYYTAFARSEDLVQIQKLFASLDLEILAVSGVLHPLTKVLTPEKLSGFNALLVDIGGQTTEVAIIFGGGIVGTKTLDIGGYHLSLFMAQSMGISLEAAEQKKLAYSQGALSEEEGSQVRDLLRKPVSWWISGLQTALSEFEGVKTFPDRFLLGGGGAALLDLQSRVSQHLWGRYLPFRSEPRPEVLNVSQLGLVQELPPELAGPGWVPTVSLATCGLEILGEKH